MEMLVGNRDIQQIKNPVGKEVFQLLYGDSEYYNYVCIFLRVMTQMTRKQMAGYLLPSWHRRKGDDLNELLSYGVPKHIMETGPLTP